MENIEAFECLLFFFRPHFFFQSWSVQAQFTPGSNSKCYSDHDTLNAALDAVCVLFESKLRQNTSVDTSYDIQDLFHFLDGLPDIVMLVFNKNTASYDPHNRDWIKKALYEKFLKASTPRR